MLNRWWENRKLISDFNFDRQDSPNRRSLVKLSKSWHGKRVTEFTMRWRSKNETSPLLQVCELFFLSVVFSICKTMEYTIILLYYQEDTWTFTLRENPNFKQLNDAASTTVIFDGIIPQISALDTQAQLLYSLSQIVLIPSSPWCFGILNRYSRFVWEFYSIWLLGAILFTLGALLNLRMIT